MRLCASDVLRSAMHLLRYSLRLLYRYKNVVVGDRRTRARIRMSACRDHRRRTASAKERIAADDRTLRSRQTCLDRNERGARYFRDRSARASDHGPENSRKRRIGSEPLRKHRLSDGARRSEIVIGSREDYLWSRDKVAEFDLANRCGTVLFSPIFGRIAPREIVDWMLEDKLTVRFQLQIHKFIWSPEAKGV